ncbi:MAG: transcription-repair coupling factor [Armatimonadetes bacterium]|nr:transcription-repair coupling factor [Armatimonadota bacterium]
MRLEQITRRLAHRLAEKGLSRDFTQATAWTSVCSEARPYFVASDYQSSRRPMLLVVNSHERSVQWQAKLAIYGVPKEEIHLLPSGLSVLFEDAAPETVALSDRIGALRFLASGEPGIVIASPQAALERSLPPEVLRDDQLQLKPGNQSDVMELVDQLKRLGYQQTEPVRIPGQFSRRGGILDVFPMGEEQPVRIEYFDDEIETIRLFDPMSQRSIRNLELLDLGVTRETLLPDPDSGIDDLIERTLQIEMASLGDEEAKTLETLVESDLNSLRSQIFFDRLDLYRPIIQSEGPCAVDFLSEHGLLILDEPLELDATLARHEEEFSQALTARHERGEILQSVTGDFLASPLIFQDAPQAWALSAMNGLPDWFPSQSVEVEAKTLATYKGQPESLVQAIGNWQKSDLCIVMATDQPVRSKSVLAQVEIFPTDIAEGNPLEDGQKPFPTGMFWLDGNPAGGFVSPQLGLAVVTDQELFGVGRLKMPQRKFSDGVPIATVLDLKPGDYVVHINFGIGVFRGLVTRESEGIQKEFLHIEYKAPDRLFVPADQLDRIQKYVSPGDAPPKVNRLTGGEWKKTVGKAREDAREFARELINLYAERKRATREGYGEDTSYQIEMENTFPFQETHSQMDAIIEVKRDLQADFPMDRLICGDVGFGKTEVAIRAAFKVSEAGRQVAFLCPTTILSEQHYRNFQERLGGLPVKVALLNRFVTAGERRKVLEDLAKGEVHIIIGTHALLSDELKFKDLGMLIIDEEQKFGVKHKEALKSIRSNVDVLTLSATPIPRTLSMAIMNIRQMSLINDPIPGRLPVRTHVRPWSSEVVREAILRELSRGGQIYFVTHRVQGIGHIAERLRQLVPTARIAIGHGQMSEKEIEPVMVGFVKGEIDILVSTTIVESGLDIPNANTMIIDNADRFGLAQLYQLRGRVGRSDRQAYAYLLYSDSKSLTENAGERLKALAEFNQLGSGYSLAFRDLQIRGAGDLLGAKQSGQMAAVGYDLYTQLIDSEVKFLKTFADGEKSGGVVDPLAGLEPLPPFDLPVQALIPNWYVPDEGQRLFLYKQMMSARDPKVLGELRSEMEDRYGHLPDEVDIALNIMGVRMRARDRHIIDVDGNQGRLKVTFHENFPILPRIFRTIQRKHHQAYMSEDKMIWPFSGDPVRAANAMIDSFAEAEREIEEEQEFLSKMRE